MHSKLFIDQIRDKYPLLTRSQENHLILKAQQGDELAKNKLIMSNMGLVTSIASKSQNQMLTYEDLIQEGVIGLIRSLNLFNVHKGYKFSTYATYWIKQAINRALENKSRLIRIPSHSLQILRSYEKLKSDETLQGNPDLSIESLSKRLNVSAFKLNELIQSQMEPLSFDQEIGENDKLKIEDIITDPDSYLAEIKLSDAEKKICLHKMIKNLNPKEQVVMKLKLSYSEYPTTTSRTIAARKLNLTKERIRQIEHEALKKLKNLISQGKYASVFID